MSTLRLISLLLVGLALVAAETPDGSPICTVYWIVPESCPDAMLQFRAGIYNWNQNNACREPMPNQQMCEFYKLAGTPNGDLLVPQVGQDPYIIRVYHVYLPQVYLEMMDFNFTSTASGCFITGDSMTHADDDLVQGLVYCAMERIMIESGMTEMAGFAEMTSDAICPNYSDSDCYTGNASRS